MNLRNLQEKDIPFILEWMKDGRVNQNFRFDPQSISETTVQVFVENSNQAAKKEYHFAIVDDADQYWGSVSLKQVDLEAKNAEYAIALRFDAQGKGLGYFATKEILKFGFINLGLERVYLNVLSVNHKAIKFYVKFGFIYEGEFFHHVNIRGSLKSLKWFRMMKSEFLCLLERKNNDR